MEPVDGEKCLYGSRLRSIKVGLKEKSYFGSGRGARDGYGKAVTEAPFFFQERTFNLLYLVGEEIAIIGSH